MKTLMFSIEMNKIISGENNIKHLPYQSYLDYKKTAFPSGDTVTTTNLLINFLWAYSSKISMFFNYQYIDNVKSNDNIFKIKYVLQSILEIWFKIMNSFYPITSSQIFIFIMTTFP